MEIPVDLIRSRSYLIESIFEITFENLIFFLIFRIISLLISRSRRLRHRTYLRGLPAACPLRMHELASLAKESNSKGCSCTASEASYIYRSSRNNFEIVY